MTGQSPNPHAVKGQSQATDSAGHHSGGQLYANYGPSRVCRVSAETGGSLRLVSPAGGSLRSRMTRNVRCFETRS